VEKQREKHNWLGKGRVGMAHADNGVHGANQSRNNFTQPVQQVQVQVPGSAYTQPSAHNQKLCWSESSKGQTQVEIGQHSG
jgi:hypothetical protein